MQYRFNNEAITCEEAPTVGQVVDKHVGTRDGVAVAVDGDVVPRSQWDQATLVDGARVDVLAAVQGG